MMASSDIPQKVLKGILNTKGGINPFPLKKILRGYGRQKMEEDLRAGISVAMLSFSMSIAYAMIAGLPISYGLFGCIAAAFASLIFSSSRFIMFGPSNASAIMLMSAFASLGLATESQRAAAAAAIVVLVGIFLILASIFKITNFVRYVSRTVITGYICAGAALIFSNQLKSALGIRIENPSSKFFAGLNQTFQHIDAINWQALSIAAAAVIAMYACKKFFKRLPAQAAALVFCAVLCAALKKPLGIEVDYISAVSITDWSVSVPNFEGLELRRLIVASMAVALFCVIEATSIGKSLAAKNAERLNTNQEIFSLGMANLFAGFLSGTVESGSLTRSAAGADAGTKTTVVNFFSGIFMLAGILIFGKFIGYIPRPALSGIIMALAFTLFNRTAVRLALKSTRADAAVFLLTFITGLASSLDDAIYVGVCASIVLFLKKASSPEVIELDIGDDGREKKKNSQTSAEISIVHVGGNLFFGASEVFQDQMRRICESPNLKVLLLKLGNAINFDATSAGDIMELAIQMRRRGGVLLVCEVQLETLAILKNSGVEKVVGGENIFEFTPENTTLSTALALRRAKKYLDLKKSELQILV
ncbi:MAG: SulP family inorganic anion transporter [Opitutales bacterium]|nr:SulP family inorganic anion transporter [Opitutales bacterium]